MDYLKETNETISGVAEEKKVTLSTLEVEDRGGFVWGIIGFLSPVLGLILHLLMRKSLPRNASALKKGVIVGLVLIIALLVAYILFIVIGVMGFLAFR